MDLKTIESKQAKKQFMPHFVAFSALAHEFNQGLFHNAMTSKWRRHLGFPKIDTMIKYEDT
jgi:hypothetical protein